MKKTAIMPLIWAFMGLVGLALLFVSPLAAVIVLFIAFIGWASWATRMGLEARMRERMEQNARSFPEH